MFPSYFVKTITRLLIVKLNIKRHLYIVIVISFSLGRDFSPEYSTNSMLFFFDILDKFHLANDDLRNAA